MGIADQLPTGPRVNTKPNLRGTAGPSSMNGVGARLRKRGLYLSPQRPGGRDNECRRPAAVREGAKGYETEVARHAVLVRGGQL